MSEKIKAIVKRPDELFGHVTWIHNNLNNLQRTVDGYIETVTIGSLVLIVDEEGIIKGKPYNCRIAGFQLFGTIIAVGQSGEEFSDIPISFKEWKELIE